MQHTAGPVHVHLLSLTTYLQVEALREAFEEKLGQLESQLAGHEGPFLLG